MQFETNQLMRQQQILKNLGFYYGKLDGVWGPKSIEAKKRFEGSPLFIPGIPNTGMPFGDRPPYPLGITVSKGLLFHESLNAVAEVTDRQKGAKNAAPADKPVELPVAQVANAVPEGVAAKK